MNNFGQVLRQLIEGGEHRTMLAFAKAVKTGQGWISQICAGSRTPPLPEMDQWANALNLKGKDRQLFKDLAAMAHIPAGFRIRYELMVYKNLGLQPDEDREMRRAASPKKPYRA